MVLYDNSFWTPVSVFVREKKGNDRISFQFILFFLLSFQKKRRRKEMKRKTFKWFDLDFHSFWTKPTLSNKVGKVILHSNCTNYSLHRFLWGPMPFLFLHFVCLSLLYPTSNCLDIYAQKHTHTLHTDCGAKLLRQQKFIRIEVYAYAFNFSH